MKFMSNFINNVKNILEEQGKSTDNLFNDKILSKNTFYKYNQRFPSLPTLIKIANYLRVNIDYLLELSDNNNFKHYSTNQKDFYKNLLELINSSCISNRKFCRDLNFSRDNINRWKNGTTPSVQILLEIAQYFECSIDDLLTHENKIL